VCYGRWRPEFVAKLSARSSADTEQLYHVDQEKKSWFDTIKHYLQDMMKLTRQEAGLAADKSEWRRRDVAKRVFDAD